MAKLVAVATLDLALLGAVLGEVALSTTIVASTSAAAALGAVLGEVAHLVTLAALDTGSRTRLSAL